MRVIQTHEQADFDAIASLMGAYLLDPEAVPILPRRLNRNVRSFLTLYGASLPFVDVRDLVTESVESVTLVDTQSLVTMKGMNKHTKVYVIDHHDRRENLPEDWVVNTERVGATTTLFVESFLSESHFYVKNIDGVMATLLLLGIYEDTGSLTYVGTTPRDVWASAYLLELGASLRVVSDYLNTPLSDGQRHLYDQLLASVQVHIVHGQNLVIASAEAEDLSEEISSIAHKLRDLLELDALFLLVKTYEGIRLVARSSSDQVDVSRVAAVFGGGGHARAAAALIRSEDLGWGGRFSGEDLNGVVDFLIDLLPEIVKPSIRVEELMSEHPTLLTPQTSVAEAANLMLKFGFEGYPVIDDGRVIGLLTRRSVDRALNHKLNLTAAQMMEAGEFPLGPYL